MWNIQSTAIFRSIYICPFHKDLQKGSKKINLRPNTLHCWAIHTKLHYCFASVLPPRTTHSASHSAHGKCYAERIHNSQQLPILAWPLLTSVYFNFWGLGLVVCLNIELRSIGPTWFICQQKHQVNMLLCLVNVRSASILYLNLKLHYGIQVNKCTAKATQLSQMKESLRSSYFPEKTIV